MLLLLMLMMIMMMLMMVMHITVNDAPNYKLMAYETVLGARAPNWEGCGMAMAATTVTSRHACNTCAPCRLYSE
jgi:hypothetical protein